MIVEEIATSSQLAAWINRLPPPLLFCRKIVDLEKHEFIALPAQHICIYDRHERPCQGLISPPGSIILIVALNAPASSPPDPAAAYEIR